MPLRNIDYSKTIIYKIVCNDLNIKDCYVGHTTNFIKRKNEHLRTCNNSNGKCYNLKIYKTIRENGGIDNWSFIMIEKYPCNNGDEARVKERFWYESLNSNLNTYCPVRCKMEYYNANKDKIKKYRDDNEDKIKQYRKNYYESNKEKIAESIKEKCICECGIEICKNKKSIHLKSQRHLKIIESLNKE